ncbi:14019_t:CDS:2, partial [Cetraspora pellucida]
MAQSQLNLSFEGIPKDFNYSYLYFPKRRYKTLTLMSTKKLHIKNIKKKTPPRPPNKFFLFKNAFMLEYKRQYQKRFEKLSMPNLCKYTQELWKNAPEEVKTTYAKLAGIPHRKGKSVNDQEDSFMSKNMSTFSSTTLLEEQLLSPLVNSLSTIEDSQTTISPVATPPIISSTTTSPIINSLTTPFDGSPIINSLTTPFDGSPLINSLTTPFDGSPLISSLEGQTFFIINSPTTPSDGSPLISSLEGQTFFQSSEEFGFPSNETQFTLPSD